MGGSISYKGLLPNILLRDGKEIIYDVPFTSHGHSLCYHLFLLCFLTLTPSVPNPFLLIPQPTMYNHRILINKTNRELEDIYPNSYRNGLSMVPIDIPSS